MPTGQTPGLRTMTFNFSIDFGATIALIVGLGGIALAVFLGFRGFTKGMTGPLTRIEEKVNSLASIPTDVTAARQRLDDLWDILSNSISMLQGQTHNAVEATLPNLGFTRVSATPGSDKTEYLIESDKPVLNTDLVSKISKESGLEEKEVEMFGQITRYTDLGRNRMILHIPSTDAKACATFARIFLQWLDSTYIEARARLLEEFEGSVFPSG